MFPCLASLITARTRTAPHACPAHAHWPPLTHKLLHACTPAPFAQGCGPPKAGVGGDEPGGPRKPPAALQAPSVPGWGTVPISTEAFPGGTCVSAQVSLSASYGRPCLGRLGSLPASQERCFLKLPAVSVESEAAAGHHVDTAPRQALPAGSALTPPPPSPRGDRADSAASPRRWGRQALRRWPTDVSCGVCLSRRFSEPPGAIGMITKRDVLSALLTVM